AHHRGPHRLDHTGLLQRDHRLARPRLAACSVREVRTFPPDRGSGAVDPDRARLPLRDRGEAGSVNPSTPVGRTLDDLDRRIVAALQLDGRASWSAIAELCGTTAPTVARRVQQLSDEGALKVAVMRGAGGSESHQFYFLRLKCGPAMALPVASRIAA